MNRLFYGDYLEVLQNSIEDESVDLCYVDPPFNSKRNYNQIYNNVGQDDFAQAQAFVDTWTWNGNAFCSTKLNVIRSTPAASPKRLTGRNFTMAKYRTRQYNHQCSG